MDKKKLNRINRVPGITYREGVTLKSEPREESKNKIRSPVYSKYLQQQGSLNEQEERPSPNQKVRGINSIISHQLNQSQARPSNQGSSRNASSSVNRNSSVSKERPKFRSSKYETEPSPVSQAQKSIVI